MGFWSSLFGSSGYKPSKDLMKQQNKQVQEGYSSYLQGGNPMQNFSYQPGSSGYNYASVINAPQSLQNLADPYYAGITNQQNEAAKMGAQSGMESMMSNMGRRGTQSGGIARMQGGGMVDALSRQIASNTAQNAYQRAQDMTRLQGQDVANQMQYNNQALNAMQMQRAADEALRQEQMGYYGQGMQGLASLYGANLAPASKSSPGLFGRAAGGLQTLGSGLESMGKAYNAF